MFETLFIAACAIHLGQKGLPDYEILGLVDHTRVLHAVKAHFKTRNLVNSVPRIFVDGMAYETDLPEMVGGG